MRKSGLNAIYDLAKIDKNVHFIGSDLGVDTLKEFSLELPDQFHMEGVSEGHMIGMAAGMASCGATVYVNTIATFLTRRALDQIVINLCLDNTKVRIYGNGGGLVYGPLGATHTAIEDISILSAVPNMTILSPCDANEMVYLIKESHNFDGPIYFRLGKGGEKILTKSGETKIGKAKFFPSNESKKTNLICTTGVMNQRAHEVQEMIGDLDILHFPTVKPFDLKALHEHTPQYKNIVTLEENVPHGGLGQQVATALLENKVSPDNFKRLSLPDRFIEEYARQEELFETIGLSPKAIAETIRNLNA